jgi:EAL domain-containing protein (putative c-di-GMP-specific phosphodiesterase class I)
MYSAKEARTGYAFYAPEQLTNDATSLALIGELRRAVEQAELTLFFQPKVNMATGQVDGVEGLARWYHPQRGLIGPGSFISLTEHSHLLRPVTLHLLKCALREQSRWKAAGYNLSVAVNLSPQNLFDPELPTDLQRMLDRYGVAPGELELELTEGMVMTKPGRATEMLQKLHRMGIAISVDDFGTGYSSLSYLNSLPVSRLKIDRSFVMNLTEERGSETIVQSTIELAHNLGLGVVAEGVETEAAWDRLAELGCDHAQGYLMSQPLAPDAFIEWLEDYAARTSAPVQELAAGIAS